MDLGQVLQQAGITDPLPVEIAEGLGDLGVITVDHAHAIDRPDLKVRPFTAQPLSSRMPSLQGMGVEAPGITAGLRGLVACRLDNGVLLEWALDLDLPRVAVLLDGVRAATEVRSPTAATRLAPMTGRSDVRLVGRGVLRIGGPADQAPTVSLIDRLDRQQPFADQDVYATLTAEPASFFLGSSKFGMTVRDVVYDRSTTQSPPPREAAWKGFAVKEAMLYLPPGAPLLGDVSLGVRDVYLGDPVGVQGVAVLEFGGTEDRPVQLALERRDGATWQPLALDAVAPGAAGVRQDRFTAALPAGAPLPVRVRSNPTHPPVAPERWTVNARRVDPTGFDVVPGDVLEVRHDDEAVPGPQVSRAPTRVAFHGSFPQAATVTASHGAHSWANTASVGAGRDALQQLTFTHVGGVAGTYSWRWDGAAHAAASFTPSAAQATVGRHVLELLYDGRPVRRVEVDGWLTPGLLVGHAGGVAAVDGSGAVVTVHPVAVAHTWELAPWHLRGEHDPTEPATISGGVATVAPGTIAEVTTDLVAGTTLGTGTVTPSAARLEKHTLHFVFDTINPTDATVAEEWVQQWPAGTRIYIVGRCDDIGTQPYNLGLGQRRADEARRLLTAWRGSADDLSSRCEQVAGWNGTAPPPGPPVTAEVTDAQWLCDTLYHGQWTQDPDDHVSIRREYRAADLYVVVPAPAAGELPPGGPSTQTLRALLPGADPSPVVAATVAPAERKHPQYKVRVEVEWDDLTAAGLTDATPMRAEAWISWPGRDLPLPAGRPPAALRAPGAGPPQPTPVWTLHGRWAHDQGSGDDSFLLSLDVAGDPDGLLEIEGPFLAATFGLAPALVGAVGTPAGAEAASVAALSAVIGGIVSQLLGNESRTVVTGVTIEHVDRGPSTAGDRTRLTVDYVVELAVDVGNAFSLDVRTRPGRPMKLRFRGVGVEIDTARTPWYESVALITRDSVPEIVDPGSWQLGDPLDDLLRVTGVRSGAGSSWLEVDLAVSLDLGVVTLSDATVRIAFSSGGVEGVELRGLTAKVDVPGVIKGEGSVSVGDGAFRAGIQAEIVPVKVAAMASLATGPGGFYALEAGVRFPAPLPFANSGLGLYGLAGRFVSNGTRNVVRTETDVVRRELDWLHRPASQKYVAEPGQYALGLGAVIGTVADNGFTFNAQGMVTVEFPRPSVILAIQASVVSGTAPVPSEQVGPQTGGLRIDGLVVIDDTAVTIAMKGNYTLPGILVVEAPFGAYFPYAHPVDSYLHIGVDDHEDRLGAPVQVRLLPDILDVRATSYTMVHGNGLQNLGGHDDFDFSGFAVGFGAGFGLDWSAGPIRLSASAEFCAGLGTNPFFLAAGIWVRGELDLVIASIAARGEIVVRTDGDLFDLHGRFCGEIDCFFFSISGCVEFEITNTLPSLPDPESPVAGIDLVARMGHATAKAARPGETEPVVWIDTIPAISFDHTVANAFDPATAQFDIGTPLPGPVWSGSRDVKHAFRLTGVTLTKVGAGPVAPVTGTRLPATWWWPGVRDSGAPNPYLSASGSEARNLALLSWTPWGGVLPLTEPDGSPGDPGGLVGSVCDPVRRPDGLCVIGELGVPAGPGRVRLHEDPAEVPASRGAATVLLDQPGDRPWAQLLAAASSYGLGVVGGGVVPLDQPADLLTGTRHAGWRLAGLERQGQEIGSLGATGSYVQRLCGPSLVLELCPVPWRTKELEPIDDTQGCVRFGDLDDDVLARLVDERGTLSRDGLRIGNTDGGQLQTADFGGRGAGLLVIGEGLAVELDRPVGGVWLHGSVEEEWWAHGFDADGNEIAKDANRDGAPLRLRADGLTRVEVRTHGENVLLAVCPDDRDPLAGLGGLLTWTPGDEPVVPEVVGILPDGSELPWHAKVHGERGCRVISYFSGDDREYVGFRIPAVPGAEVTVVGTCGTLWVEELEVRRADQARQDVLGLLGVAQAVGALQAEVGVPDGGATGGLALPVLPVLQPAPRTLLEPGVTYEVTVDWAWQRWQRTDTQPVPPPAPSAADADWHTGAPSVFRFRTAVAAPAPPPRVEHIREDFFEPRSLARYVTGAEPDGGLPHLLDDPIRVHLSVDYVAAFLDRYGYDARVEVRPSDVDAGTVSGPNAHPWDVVTHVAVKVGARPDLFLPVEQRVSEVSVDAPCLGGVSPVGTGSTLDVTADLDPVRGYDLILVAHPRQAGRPDVPINRWHFRTSRYHHVGEVLAECGLDPVATNPVPPADALLEHWPAGGLPQVAHDDRVLDQWFAALGRDPWPTSATPRATTLWVPPAAPGTGWRLAGLLVEALEPVVRRGRITLTADVDGQPLITVASSGTGTRVLLAAGAPFVPSATATLGVTAHDTVHGDVTGRVLLMGQPRSVRSEKS